MAVSDNLRRGPSTCFKTHFTNKVRVHNTAVGNRLRCVCKAKKIQREEEREFSVQRNGRIQKRLPRTHVTRVRKLFSELRESGNAGGSETSYEEPDVTPWRPVGSLNQTARGKEAVAVGYGLGIWTQNAKSYVESESTGWYEKKAC
uniref:Uncharacterized protein n=1 Tax=Schistocephalus solidus TaxID=70667 RepID=A0A0V0JAM5_SCHSO